MSDSANGIVIVVENQSSYYLDLAKESLSHGDWSSSAQSSCDGNTGWNTDGSPPRIDPGETVSFGSQSAPGSLTGTAGEVKYNVALVDGQTCEIKFSAPFDSKTTGSVEITSGAVITGSKSIPDDDASHTCMYVTISDSDS